MASDRTFTYPTYISNLIVICITYFTLIHPSIEYTSAAWEPYTKFKYYLTRENDEQQNL